MGIRRVILFQGGRLNLKQFYKSLLSEKSIAIGGKLVLSWRLYHVTFLLKGQRIKKSQKRDSEFITKEQEKKLYFVGHLFVLIIIIQNKKIGIKHKF